MQLPVHTKFNQHLCIAQITGVYLMPPTSTKTSATAIFFAALKFLESAIFTVPPSYFIGSTVDRG